MYTHRLWGTRDAFTSDDVAFHTEPYGDAQRLRASWGVYEQSVGKRPMEDVPRLFEQTPVPTLVLYGPEDHVVLPSFPWKAAAACSRLHRPADRARRGPLPPMGVRRHVQQAHRDVLSMRMFCR